MQLTCSQMRTEIEKALRSQAPGDSKNLDADGEFLVLRGSAGAEIVYVCDESEVRLDFGPSGGAVWEYNTTDEETGNDNFTADDLKELLKNVVQETLDIVSERVFAATYKNWFTRVGGLYPVAEFASISKKKEFESRSWKGTFTRNIT